jgi:hypothetical protein
MSIKKIYLALLGLLVMLILVGVIFFYDDDLNKNYACVKHEEFIMEKWKGVVAKKYIDSSNHNAETIKLQSETIYAIFRDGTEFFKFIEIGDSIVKKINTDSVKIYRNGSVYCFKVDFGCYDNE